MRPLLRLTRRLFAPTTPIYRKPLPFRPRFDPLERRDVPANTFHWVGWASGDYLNPANWAEQSPTAGGGTVGSYPAADLPGPADALEFGPLSPAFDAFYDPFPGPDPAPWDGDPDTEPPPPPPPPLYPCGNLSGTYDRVEFDGSDVALWGPVTANILQVYAGNVDQRGYDLTVTGADEGVTCGVSFVWYGGTINSGSQPANLNIAGGSGDIQPSDGASGVLTTGDTIRQMNSSQVTFESGAINFTQGNGLDVGGDSEFDVEGGTDDSPLQFISTAAAPVLTHVEPNNRFVVEGALTQPFGFWNEGMVTINMNQTLTCKGQVTDATGNVISAASYYQSLPSGSDFSNCYTRLQSGATLTTANGTEIAGGALTAWISWECTSKVTISGNLTVSGTWQTTLVNFLMTGGPPAGAAYGWINVTGNLNWSGGQYQPGFNRTNNNEACTWTVNGTVTIGAAAVLRPVETNPTAPLWAGDKWDVLNGKTITGTPRLWASAVSMSIDRATTDWIYIYF